ncbi:uncharacterized protein LOC111802300 [Cucurbita pepo subsp. pepo]|uniref:uncharacterized protein LOC111802300 n=1 Tax=Cucurbita pepo subsp. pepo TaxID=3664 RepID=UPI000C9D83D6|nr:uncharacterized protein LOC111802300 [Cucurbita pepo subsp. pepo]
MTFGSPILAPDLPIINEYVVEGIHGLIFTKFSSDALIRALSILCSDGRLTRIANNNASSGRLLTKNVLATECIAGYTNLLEEVLKRFAYPSKSLKGQGGQSAFTRYTADLVLGHFCIMVLFFVDLVLMFVDFIRCRRQEA